MWRPWTACAMSSTGPDVVMVAIDEEGKAVPVPGLIVETESEKAEWEAGEKRYQLRKQRRLEGF